MPTHSRTTTDGDGQSRPHVYLRKLLSDPRTSVVNNFCPEDPLMVSAMVLLRQCWLAVCVLIGILTRAIVRTLHLKGNIRLVKTGDTSKNYGANIKMSKTSRHRSGVMGIAAIPMVLTKSLTEE